MSVLTAVMMDQDSFLYSILIVGFSPAFFNCPFFFVQSEKAGRGLGMRLVVFIKAQLQFSFSINCCRTCSRIEQSSKVNGRRTRVLPSTLSLAGTTGEGRGNGPCDPTRQESIVQEKGSK